MTAASLNDCLEDAAARYPYPIAMACETVRRTEPRDDWHVWELLSRDLLTPVLVYTSHLLLSDLVATGREPAHLFHRIESILSRPLAGHYVGFLRETARYYRDNDLDSAVPALVNALYDAEVDATLTDSGRPLLGELLRYRNRWAHGRIENKTIVRQTVREIRSLIASLLDALEVLVDLPLTLEDGTVLMGSTPSLPTDAQPLVTISVEDVSLRPLLLKLDGPELSVLTDADLRERRLTYRSPSSYTQFDTDDLDDNADAARLFDELRTLLRRVRALDALLPRPDLDSFRQRTAVQTNRQLTLYGPTGLGKYDPDVYIARPAWDADDGRFDRFLESNKTLWAIDGAQGTGKSALAAHLATRATEDGHIVWFLNAQRFTFAHVSYSGNPFPRYLADRLSYEAPFDRSAIERLVRDLDDSTRLVLFIDSINEVDALDARWNRFKAIQQLLVWVADIAHPALKVVLTFRTEAYTRYDFLQPDDLPDEIEAFSFQSDADERPWVHTLDSFTPSQAAALYARLRERGQAPVMTWNEVQSALGPALDEFVTNPLLFPIFVRAHEGRDSIRTTDRDVLFRHYVDGVTGAREQAEQSGWKRAYRYVKNGDVSPTERFLADCVEKASESGTPSFLVSDLAPEDSDRDRRILDVLSAPGRRDDMEQLQEADVLVDERIQDTGTKTGTDRRVSFTSELLTVAMERIGQAIRQRLQGVKMLYVNTYLLLGFAILFGATNAGIRYLTTGGLWASADRSLAPRLAAADAFVWDVMVHIAPFIAMVLIAGAYLNRFGIATRVSPDAIGIAEYALYRRIENENLRIVIAVAEVVLVGLSVFLMVWAANLVFGFATLPPVYYPAALAIGLLVLSIEPHISNYVIRDGFSQPLRVRDRLISRIDQSVQAVSTPFHSGGTLTFVLAMSLMMYTSYEISNRSFASGFNDSIHSLQDLMYSMAYYTDVVNLSIDYTDLSSPLLAVFPLFLLLPIGAPFLSSWFDRCAYGVYRRFLGRQTAGIRIVYRVTIPLYVSLVLLGCGGWMPSVHEWLYATPPPDSVRAHHPALHPHLQEMTSQQTETRYAVDLQSAGPLPEAALRGMQSISVGRLTLSGQQVDTMAIGAWPSIAHLVISGDSLTFGTDDASMRLAMLTIRGHANNLHRLGDLYPLLGTLNVTETSIQKAGGLPALWEEAFIHIRSDGPPQLDWLQPRSSSYIFEFSTPPANGTENLSRLRHVVVPAHDLNPSVLERMHNLNWLLLTGSPCTQDPVPDAHATFCETVERIAARQSFGLDHLETNRPFVDERIEMLASVL